MILLKKGMRLFKNDGIRAVFSVLSQKVRNRANSQIKYDKWIQKFEYQMPMEIADSSNGRNITLISADEGMWKKLQSETGDYFAFFYKGDSLSKDWSTLAAGYIKRHPGVKFFYTNEDSFSQGKRVDPLFKPEWSPDTYLSYDYIGGLLIIKREIAQKAGSILLKCGNDIENRYKDARLYALGLCASELVDQTEIGFFNRVLYHREFRPNIEIDNLVNVKDDLINRRGLNAYSEIEEKSKQVRIVYIPDESKKISFIIPSKNQSDVIEKCISSIEEGTKFDNYEWIIVDNGSYYNEKIKYQRLSEGLNHFCNYIYAPSEFNFSAMCNLGAKFANGDIYVFLNDDMSLPKGNGEWLTRLIGAASVPYAGAVGAKLLYPDSTIIQHIGVVNYSKGAAHLFWKSDDEKVLPFNRNCIDTNTSIVTGAALAIEQSKFDEVGGFCEQLTVTYNDVELCISLLEKGYFNILRTDVVLYHHESLARGEDSMDITKYKRCLKEREILSGLHPDFIGIDPFYNSYLTQHDLNGLIETESLALISKPKRVTIMPEVVKNGEIKYRIDSISSEEFMHIRGWSFAEHPGNERISLLLVGKKVLRFDTKTVYDNTKTDLFDDGRSYGFIGFESIIRHVLLPQDEYRIFIKIGMRMVDTGRTIKSDINN